MKKFISSTLIVLIFATLVAGCTAIDPKRVGEVAPVKVADNTQKTESVDQLLAPPTGKDLYEDQTILKMGKGKAIVQHSNGIEESVDSQLAVVPGDTIIVQMGGAGTVEWFDDSISRLKEGTTLTIDKADFDTSDITKTAINFHVVKGEIWNKVRGLVNPDSEFLSYAGSVVSGVRGSVYNLTVEGSNVTVESVEHSAFLAPVDLKTNTIGAEKRIVRGQLAKFIGKGSIKLAVIAPKRLNAEWFTGNGSEDKTASTLWAQKNKERLINRIGALPGDPGYVDKTNRLQAALDAIKDPTAHAEFQARLAQLKANEDVALALKNPDSLNAESATSAFDSVQSAIQATGLSDEVRKRLKAEAQTQLQVLDRSLENALPETDSAFKVKDALRNTEVKLAPDEKAQKVIKEKLLERTYFELNDAKSNPDFVMPKDLSAKFTDVQAQLKTVSDFWQDNQAFQNDYMNIIKDIQANPTDPAAIQKLQNYFQDPVIQQKLQETQKVMEQALPAIQEQLKNLPAGTLPTTELPTANLPTVDSKVNLLGAPAVDVPTLPGNPTVEPAPSTDTAPVEPSAIAPTTTIPLDSVKIPTIAPSTLNLLNTKLPLIR